MRSGNELKSSRLSENGRAAVAPPSLSVDVLSPSAPSGRTLQPEKQKLCISQGRSGDHVAVHHFLLAMMQGPSASEFQSQLDNPYYEPSNRLLIQHAHRILSHLQLSQRSLCLDNLLLPITDLSYLATLPEYRQRGLTTALLAAADQQMVNEGSLLGRLRTSNSSYFRKQGWFVFGRHSYSLASPRDILSCLEHRRSPERSWPLTNDPQVSVRLWRHVEQDAIVRLYNNSAARCYGGIERQDAYWRWLISRQAYDRIYVAVRSKNGLELNETEEASEESDASIIGYAILRKGQIAELIVDPAEKEAGEKLIERACYDAIERDDHSIRLDAPPNDPLHSVLVESGGQFHYHEADRDEVTMAKIFDPLQLLQSMRSLLLARVKKSASLKTLELGLLCNGEKIHLRVSSRGLRISAGKLGRSHLKLEGHAFSQALLGHLDIGDEVRKGQIESASSASLRAASLLFPRLPLWRPPLDDLPAGG